MGRVSLLVAGLLLFFVSIPLALRKVPMNRYYGFRTAAAFKSEQDWYDINAYAGKQMAFWSLLLIAAGIAGFFLPPEYKEMYERWSPIFLVAVIVIALIRVSIWSRRHGS